MSRSRTAYVILGVLAIHSNQSGYEIRRTVQYSVGYFWGESYGQIYPTLKRLEAESLIAKSNSTTASRKRRQEYSITPAGRACLEAWLAVPYQEDPPRDEFLLKLFFGNEVSPSVSIAHVRRFQDKLRLMLASLEQLEPLARANSAQYPGFPFWMLTLSFGKAQLRSALEWSESAMEVLSADEPATTSNPLLADGIPAVQSA
jgi:PadR family transcriptional regulator AphA